MFATPAFARDTHAALDFVEDQQYFILVADCAQRLQKLAAKMIISSFALDRLNNNRRDIDAFRRDYVTNLFLGQFLLFDYRSVAFVWRQVKIKARTRNSRPRKLGEISNLARIRIGEAHGVTRATVERLLEMNDLSSALTPAGGQIFPHFPIHRCLERVLDCERASFDEEVTFQRLQSHYPRKSLNEICKLHRVNIRIRNLHLRGRQ